MYEKYCPSCKTTLSSFYQTGMLGCPDCYKAFEKEIEYALKKIQGRTFHAGKMPTANSIDRALLQEYHTLLEQKEEAEFEGKFGEMRRISEDILALKDELKKRGLI